MKASVKRKYIKQKSAREVKTYLLRVSECSMKEETCVIRNEIERGTLNGEPLWGMR